MVSRYNKAWESETRDVFTIFEKLGSKYTLIWKPFQSFIITIKDKSNRMAKVLRAAMNTGIAALRHERYAFQALN